MRRFVSPVVLAAAAIYVVLTVAITWPLARHPGTLVPNDPGDSLLNMWLMAWNARTMPLTARWWNAPQFFPVDGALAFSEHLLGLSIITTPIIVWTGNVLLAYNAAFLLSFPLCALSAYFLTFSISRRHAAAFVSGLAFGFAPYRISQLPHVQVLTAYWMPLALAALHQYFATRRSRWLVVFGAAWLMQALACGYYLIFLSVLVGLWLGWFAAGRERWQDMFKVVLTLAVSAAVLSPILYGYWKFLGAYGLRRGPEEIQAFSADVASLLNAPDNLRLWGWLHVFVRPEADLFPGVTVVAIVLLGLAIAWRAASRERVGRLRAGRVLLSASAAFALVAISPSVFGPWRLRMFGWRLISVSSSYKPLSLAVLLLVAAGLTHPAVRTAWRRRSALAFYALAAVAMWLLSLGPRPTLMNDPVLYKAPYAWLLMLPGVNGVRVPARFWMLAVMCLSVAAGLAVRRLTALWPRSALALPLCASVMIVAEGWPTPIAMWPPPPPRPSHARAVARLDLPLNPQHDREALYRAIEHRRPVLNGFSGYFAPHYMALQYLLDRHDPGLLTRLSSMGTIEIVVEHAQDPTQEWRTYIGAHPQVQQVYSDRDYTAYRLARGARAAPLPQVGGPALAIRSLSAQENPALLGAMTDGNLLSRWHAGRAQAPGDSFTADLGTIREVAGARLIIAAYVADFPRQLRIDTSGDGRDWAAAWSGGTALMTFSAVLEDPRRATLPFPFAARPARYVRFTQTGADPTYYWSVAELQIVGR